MTHNSLEAFSLPPPPFHFPPFSHISKIHKNPSVLPFFLFSLSLNERRTAMSGAGEEWVTAALSDDAMVVELLVRLHHAPPPPSLKRAAFPIPPEWTVRQRRSKYASAKKPAQRGSPITPLSSFSAGSDESSRSIPPIKLSSTTGSEVVIVDIEKANSKRSRKKKTLAELKDEENLLIKERRDLKEELAAFRSTLERQRAANGNLKRLKTELQLKKSQTTSVAQGSISSQLHTEPTLMTPPAVEGENSDAKSILPDLNMPFDEPSSEMRC